MKKNKLAIILVSVVALLALVLFVCSFFMLKQAKKTKEEAKQMTLEALDETREEEKAADSQVVETTRVDVSVDEEGQKKINQYILIKEIGR